jgi:bifunctional non-homologous end joining protein LigD
MALTKYREKRSFKETPEPIGGRSADTDLKFVIQKHAASHLHYDFRLEMRGVLKSWAVPKGPSTDPSVKRLAMMVEDHPYDYRTFEGIIPKGQYGGGTVIVWDEGTYMPAGENARLPKKDAEKLLLNELHKGKIHFTMKGKKLKGEYALVKAHGREENSWLLMKVKDKYASTADITKKERSAVSGKTLKQIEATSTNIWQSNKAVAISKERQSHPKKAAGLSSEIKGLLKKGIKKPQPKEISPMLATLTDKPFDTPGWVYEIKWDGYRALAYLNKKKVELLSRNQKSFNEKFYPIYDALSNLSLNAVLDGEVIVADDKGMASFGNLQNWRSEADGHLLYYAFDILWYEGYDLTQLILTERRSILKAVLPETDNILLSNDFETSGTEFFAAAEKMGLEGIMAKRADSAYNIGARTTEWLKIKTQLRHEVVIGGYTKNEGTAKQFSSLLVGLFEKGKFVYTGKIGTGFNDKTQREMMKQFKPLIISSSPFDTVPDVNKPSRFRPTPPKALATWLKPELVCEVSYREITSDGVMRHPSFEGMRSDKDARSVGKDAEIKSEKAIKKTSKAIEKKYIKAPKKSERKTLLNPADDSQARKINGHEIKFTNLHKVFWPKENITKRDMLNYYYQIAPYIIPYLKDRPQSLNRFPNGITGKSFYQKDVTGKVPDWVETFPYKTRA